MREAEIKILYDSITNVSDEFVEEAQRVNLKRSHHRWQKWAVNRSPSSRQLKK